MKQVYTVLLLLFFGLLALPGHGQQQPPKLVSGTFNNTPFGQFVSQIEAQTGLRFYYDPAAVDSLFVTVQAQGQPVATVLEQALQKHEASFHH